VESASPGVARRGTGRRAGRWCDDPELASGWHTVAEFVDEAAWFRQDAFPVVGFDGELIGIVLTMQLARIPRGGGPACGSTR